MSPEDSNTMKNAEIKDKKDDEHFLKNLKKTKPSNKNIKKQESDSDEDDGVFKLFAPKSSVKAHKEADSDSDSDEEYEDIPPLFRRSSLKGDPPSSANGRKRPTPDTTTTPKKMCKRTLVDQNDANVVVSSPPGRIGVPGAPIPDIPNFFSSYVTGVAMTDQKGEEGKEKDAGKPKAEGSLFSLDDPTGEALKILDPYIQDDLAQYRKTDAWDRLNELRKTAFERYIKTAIFIHDVKDLHKRSCLQLKKARGDIKAQTDELAKLKAEVAGLVSERDAAVSAKVEAEAKVSELNEVVRIERRKWADDKLVAQRKAFEEKDKAFRDSLLLANSTAREAYKLAQDGKPYTDPFPKPSRLCQDLS